jgi:hypothetical protein
MGPRGPLLAALGLAVCGAAVAAPPKPAQVDLLCDAVYLPARSSWVRSVNIRFDDRRVQAVAIDGLPVYSFNVQGTTVLTALDNERIQIDTAAMTWSSDFRGQATSQGRCERQS